MIRKRRGHEEASLNHSNNLLNTLPVTGLETPLLASRLLLTRGHAFKQVLWLEQGSECRALGSKPLCKRRSKCSQNYPRKSLEFLASESLEAPKTIIFVCVGFLACLASLPLGNEGQNKRVSLLIFLENVTEVKCASAEVLLCILGVGGAREHSLVDAN